MIMARRITWPSKLFLLWGDFKPFQTDLAENGNYLT